VIRAATLYIVFALAGTPTAADICIAWCDATSPVSTAATCHHRTTSYGTPMVAMPEHGCDQRLVVNPFVRENPRHVAKGSASNHADVAAGHAAEFWMFQYHVGPYFYVPPLRFRVAFSPILRI
jgi:hypothetical protein